MDTFLSTVGAVALFAALCYAVYVYVVKPRRASRDKQSGAVKRPTTKRR